MFFKTIILRNQKLVFVTLAVLVFLQTALNGIAAFEGVAPSEVGNLVYSYFYILLLIFWADAQGHGLKATFDKGLFYLVIYPFFVFYECLKKFGCLKGVGLFLLLIMGFILPSIVYNVLILKFYY